MAGKNVPELDKTLQSEVGDSYGEMKIRVVVLKKRDDPDETAETEPEEEELSGTGKKPTDTYLESPKRGKECCVFVVNGQRQDAWDDTFIVRDLGLKYLRHRTLIVVDLDGLKPEAIAEIMQGSRQGFYQGTVYSAISKRLIATLKKDPDLDQLQKEAEQNLLEMKAADENVKNKLDQLIEGHHAGAEGEQLGEGDAPGEETVGGPHFGKKLHRGGVVTKAGSSVGEAAGLPVLVSEPEMVAVRMQRDQAVRLYIASEPASEWANLQDLSVRLQPEVAGLALVSERGPDRAQLALRFTEPDDMDEDEYPVSTEVVVFAKFKEHPEIRMLKLPVVIVKPREKKPKKERVLRADPTYLRVVSRQPVKLVPNGPSLHVKLVWDGEDSLLAGSPAPWGFRARCTSLATYPRIGFSFGRGGRVAALVDTPTGLIPDSELEFEVEAVGPNGKKLTATFKGTIQGAEEEPDGKEPRKVDAQSPEMVGQRRPPYKLIYIKQENWAEVGCWVDATWTANDVACFHEPTEAAPLILVLNEDFGLSKEYFASLVGRLEEATINEKKSKFYSHVAFHLYQMYLSYKKQMDRSATDADVKPPDFAEMRAEVNRVGTTLIRLMEVSR
jgi:hypothetical protein